MGKSNLTLQLDDEVIHQARVVAAKRGTSVSGLVARELARLGADDERYEAAQRAATALLEQARPRGGKSWTRDDLYAERLDRVGN